MSQEDPSLRQTKSELIHLCFFSHFSSFPQDLIARYQLTDVKSSAWSFIIINACMIPNETTPDYNRNKKSHLLHKWNKIQLVTESNKKFIWRKDSCSLLKELVISIDKISAIPSVNIINLKWGEGEDKI